jgi:hypothetical protein
MKEVTENLCQNKINCQGSRIHMYDLSYTIYKFVSGCICRLIDVHNLNTLKNIVLSLDTPCKVSNNHVAIDFQLQSTYISSQYFESEYNCFHAYLNTLKNINIELS